MTGSRSTFEAAAAALFMFPEADETWFLVRHGQPFRREGSIVDGESESVFYRPEKFDVLVYSSAASELRINAGTVAATSRSKSC